MNIQIEHEVFESARGMNCSRCKCKPATHKVSEALNRARNRHEFNLYVCCACFIEIFPQAKGWCPV